MTEHAYLLDLAEASREFVVEGGIDAAAVAGLLTTLHRLASDDDFWTGLAKPSRTTDVPGTGTALGLLAADLPETLASVGWQGPPSAELLLAAEVSGSLEDALMADVGERVSKCHSARVGLRQLIRAIEKTSGVRLTRYDNVSTRVRRTATGALIRWSPSRRRRVAKLCRLGVNLGTALVAAAITAATSGVLLVATTTVIGYLGSEVAQVIDDVVTNSDASVDAKYAAELVTVAVAAATPPIDQAQVALVSRKLFTDSSVGARSAESVRLQEQMGKDLLLATRDPGHAEEPMARVVECSIAVLREVDAAAADAAQLAWDEAVTLRELAQVQASELERQARLAELRRELGLDIVGSHREEIEAAVRAAEGEPAEIDPATTRRPEPA